MKRILVLSMFCNLEFFLNQEKIVRETWAKPIIDGEVKNMQFFGYTASEDGRYHIDYKNHVIQVPCDDGLHGTADKTMKTLRFIEKIGLEYDYVFRTNTSTYINIDLLDTFVLMTYDLRVIWSGVIFSSNDRSGPYSFCFHARGNSMLVSREVIKIILDTDNIKLAYRMEKTNDINNLICDIEDILYKIDDNFLCFVYNSYLLSRGIDHTKCYKTFGELGFKAILKYPIAFPLATSFRTYGFDGNNRKVDREFENEVCRSIYEVNKGHVFNDPALILEYINDDLINYSCTLVGIRHENGSCVTDYNWMPRNKCIAILVLTSDIPFLKMPLGVDKREIVRYLREGRMVDEEKLRKIEEKLID